MIKKIAIHIWEFPQHLLAFILLKVFKISHKEKYKTATVYYIDSKFMFGASLGEYILIHKDWSNMKKTIKHEYGHTLQSYMFGPLYLLIIGLPSVIQNILSSIFYKLGKPEMHRNYYKRYPESWADKLGGVDREDTYFG